MTFSEEALRKLMKDELVNLSLDYQSKFDSSIANIGRDTGELRKDFEKLEGDLAISWLGNSKLRDRIISLERRVGEIVSTPDVSVCKLQAYLIISKVRI